MVLKFGKRSEKLYVKKKKVVQFECFAMYVGESDTICIVYVYLFSNQVNVFSKCLRVTYLQNDSYIRW